MVSRPASCPRGANEGVSEPESVWVCVPFVQLPWLWIPTRDFLDLER